MPQSNRLTWNQKLQLMQQSESGHQPLARVARRFQISRQTLYKWRRRFRDGGPMALQELSRRPHGRPQALSALELERIEAVRRRYGRWGPKKIRAWLRRHYPRARLPATSTIGAALQRLSLVYRRPRRLPGPVVRTGAIRPPRRPNDIWTVDFKGWFRTLDRQRCEPLTVRDLYSRYGLLAQLLTDQRWRRVQAHFVRLFQRRGQPKAMRCDNGSPFGSNGPAGLSRLSAWWISLGIEVQFIRPACPQDNGSHEQWHRELKADTTGPALGNLRAQQVRTTRWLQQYNQCRPHEALGQRVPAEYYRSSRRRYPGPVQPNYPKVWLVRRVRSNGQIRWQGRLRFVGEAFVGARVGLRPERRQVWRVYFHHVLLGELHDADPGGLRPAIHRRHGNQPRKV
jgi:transposase InsO family protein